MIIERTKDEVIIRLPADVDTEGLQRFVNLLSYKEATAKTAATQADADSLAEVVKKGRWAKNRSKYIIDFTFTVAGWVHCYFKFPR